MQEKKKKCSVFKILEKLDLKKFGIHSIFKHIDGKEDTIVTLKKNKILRDYTERESNRLIHFYEKAFTILYLATVSIKQGQ